MERNLTNLIFFIFFRYILLHRSNMSSIGYSMNDLSSDDDNDSFEHDWLTYDLPMPRYLHTSSPMKTSPDNSEIMLKNSKVSISNDEALKYLLLSDPSNALQEFTRTIEGDRYFIVNLLSVGEDLKDGNTWKCTSGTQRNNYYSTAQGNDMVIRPRNNENPWYEVSRLYAFHLQRLPPTDSFQQGFSRCPKRASFSPISF